MNIKEALAQLDKKALKKKLVIAGFTPGGVDVSFSRGIIPQKMVPFMEEYTHISAKFWGYPKLYKTDGNRRDE